MCTGGGCNWLSRELPALSELTVASRLSNGGGEFPDDAKLYEIGAGTSEIRRMLIGRELFNASR